MSGLIIGPIFVFFIVIVYLIYRIVLHFTGRKVLSRIVFVLLVTFPFLDLIAQKAIKTYYINSGLLEPKIYAMPEKDKDGKIESLSLVGIKYFPKEYFNSDGTYNLVDVDNYKNLLNFLHGFLEVNIYDSKVLQKNQKIVRINTEKNKYSYIDNLQARFKFQTKFEQKLFGLYELITYSLVDTKRNIILGQYKEIVFLDTYSFIRNDILVMQSGNGNPLVSIKGIYKSNIKYKTLMSKLKLGEIK